jgi:ornithine cyclodeaminase
LLFLNKKDIFKAVSLKEIMDNIEKAYVIYEKKEYIQPSRINIPYHENSLLYMPCFTKDIFGTKIITVFPKNIEKQKPTIEGLMLLNDIDTGEPLALLDGKILTALRTGAAGGVSIRHLSSPQSNTIGLVGCGAQGFYQLLFAAQVRDIKKIILFDIFPQKLYAFREIIREAIPDVDICIASSIEELLDASKIVITATTSEKPVFPNRKDLLCGKHFIGIGSFKPTMREYPDALFSLLERVYVDTEYAMEESGDLLIPLQNKWIKEEQIKTMGYLLSHKKEEKPSKQETTFFKSVGMALVDLTVSQLIYQKAIENKLGQKIII